MKYRIYGVLGIFDFALSCDDEEYWQLTYGLTFEAFK